MPLKHDFLKYWRIVRYYVKAKHGLSTPDMEMMLLDRDWETKLVKNVLSLSHGE